MTGGKWIVMTVCCLFLMTSYAFCDEKIPAPEAKINKVPKTSLATPQNIDNVNKQLTEVIAANQKLQEDYMRRIEKMREISNQAKIHQRILEKIKKQTPSESSAVQQAIQQEKIRLIAEQARKNQELLKTLRSGQQKIS
ncbi:MAG: hypothetical protein HZC17_03950 [Candidatus Omnitrophica bacterium]|nr:hypothetical protein [Candidatus Omnitrophota bacterium]